MSVSVCLSVYLSVWYVSLSSITPGGVCDCNDCFERGDNVTCVQSSCDEYSYDEAELECKDDRPKQLTALLLSVFISSTGAANFYIGRDDLGTNRRYLCLLFSCLVLSLFYSPLLSHLINPSLLFLPLSFVPYS